MTLVEVYQRIEVHRIGSRHRFRCPVHGGTDLNGEVWENDRGQARFKCWSHGCDPRAIEAALGEHPAIRLRHRDPDFRKPNAAEIQQRALTIWHHSVSASNTIVTTYLRSRGITIPPPPSIRFHSQLRHPNGQRSPAMIGAVQNVEGRVVAIHRTWLKDDGSEKADVMPQKAMLGPCAGGAVRLALAGNTLVVSEGIESALSVMLACPDLPVWAALSTSGMTALQVPAGVSTVILAIDNDVPGEQAARRAAKRFLAAGLQVRIARPSKSGADFNDVLTDEA